MCTRYRMAAFLWGLIALSTRAGIGDPLLYFPFDTNTGAVVYDQSGNGYNGVISGAQYSPAGISGGAYVFDGNDGINAGRILDVGGTYSALSVCAWVRIATNVTDSQMTLVCKEEGSSPWQGWYLSTFQKAPIADLIPDTFSQCYSRPTNTVHDGKWHFVCGLFERTASNRQTTVFLDGQLKTVAQQSPAGITSNDADFAIGMRADGAFPFKGLIDEVRVYGRKLSPSEIAELYQLCASPSQTVQFASGQYAVAEGAGSAVLGVTRGGGTAGPLSVDYATTSGSAVAGSDFVATTGTLNWADGDGSAKTIAIPIVNDAVLEGSESFLVHLSGAMTGLPSDAWVTIADDDIPADAPLIYYSFDTNGGTVVEDQSGHGNHATLAGAQHVATGVCGAAYSFDGNDSINAGRILDVDSVCSTLTVCAWVRIATNVTDPQMTVISKEEGFSPWQGWYLSTYQKAPIADLIPDTFSQCYNRPTNTIHDGKWHFVCGLFERTPTNRRTTVYLDGQFKTLAQQSPAGVTSNDANLVIGMRADGAFPFKGLIDEVRVYGRILSSAEIEDLYRLCAPSVPQTAQFVATQISASEAEGSVSLSVARSGGTNGTLMVEYTTASGTATPGSDFTPQSGALTWNDGEGGIKTLQIPVANDSALEGTEYFRVQLSGVAAGTPSEASVFILDDDVPQDGPVLYYSFDTNTGSVVHDQSGYGHDAAVFGAQHIATGLRGGAYSFDGDDCINAGGILDVGGAFSTLTVCAWVRVPAGLMDSQLTIVSKEEGFNPWQGWYLSTFQQAPIADLIPDYFSQCYEKPALNLHDDRWHFLSAVFSVGQNQRRTVLYVDGQRRAFCERELHGETQNDADFVIGRRADGAFPFKGVIDELRVYPRELGSNEVSNLYKSYQGAGGRARMDASDYTGAEGDGSVCITILREGDPEGSLSLSFATSSETAEAGLDYIAASGTLLWTNGDSQPKTVCIPVLADGSAEDVESFLFTLTDASNHPVSTARIRLIDAVPVTNGLVLHYPFDRGADSDTTVIDVSGNAHHGLRAGGSYAAEGICGGSMSFDGNDSIDIGNLLDLGGTQPVLTVSVWVRISAYNTSGQMDIIGKREGFRPWQGWYAATFGQAPIADIIPDYFSQCYVKPSVNIHDGRWHHLCAVFGTTTGTRSTMMFLDGELRAASDRELSGSLHNDAHLIVGMRSDGAYPFIGQMDELRIYSRQLSSSEIVALARPCSATNEGSATGALAGIVEPVAAAAAGAKWRIQTGPATNDLWRENGDVVPGLPAGTYTVRFKDTAGWLAPPDCSVLVSVGGTSMVTGVYTSLEDRTPPTFVRFTPPDNHVAKSRSFAINVWATDNVAVARVTLNGTEMLTDDYEHFHLTKQGVRGSYNPVVLVAYDAALNASTQFIRYAQADKITLSALWDGYWRVRNPESNSVDFTWQVAGSAENGGGTVSSNSDCYFATTTGRKTLKLYVNGVLVDTATSSPLAAPTNTVAVWMLDSDGDGLSNLDEEIAGSDPDEVASSFSLRPVAATASQFNLLSASGSPLLTLSWQSSIDSAYTILLSSDLKIWTPDRTFEFIPGTGGIMQYVLPDSASVQYISVTAEKLP